MNEDADFDAALIAEATQLADLLSSQAPPAAATTAAARTATATRNRMLTLMTRAVGRVRAAARHVFRRHPEIVREVSSGYERRRRPATRRAKLAETKKGG